MTDIDAVTHGARTDASPQRFLASVGSRWLFLYLAILLLPFPLSALPKLRRLSFEVRKIKTEIGAWFGESILGMEGPLNRVFDGSGDRLVDFLWVAIALIGSLVVALVWHWRRRGAGQPLQQAWFRVWCRYYLAATLLGYGIGKSQQFPDRGLARLIDTYGDFSPMGLLWTFMAFSPLYRAFAGAVEIAAALLLLFRRTSLLGALVAIAALTHILVLDIGFDVPAKLLVLHLLLVAITIAAPNVRRLSRFFFGNKAVEAPLQATPILEGRPWLRRVAKIALILAILVPLSYRAYLMNQFTGSGREKPELYGIYKVETFQRNGESLAAQSEDRWTYMVIEWEENARVFNKNNDYLDYFTEFKREDGVLSFGPWKEQKAEWPLDFEVDENRAALQGTLEGNEVSITFTRLGPDDFRLTDRQPRWITEYPYNR